MEKIARKELEKPDERMKQQPSSRDEAKARAFAGDFIEDYFMTYDGNPNPPYSKIISIS